MQRRKEGREGERIRRGEKERERLPARVTMIGRLGLPMVPHATLRTLKVHMVGVVDRVGAEQVTIVVLVTIGQTPQVELTV